MDKLVISQSIGIILIKSKKTRVITYSCRYPSRHLIPIIQSCQDELGIKCPLESLQLLMIPLVSLLMIPIDCKITYTCFL